jgi:glycosyltransferase involved in cell wall biosynthesis
MKIAVYTISKNEEHNVNGFMDAVGDVPVYILDTGSTDNTVELLKKRGAVVQQEIITPWRFDTARNKALALVPSDVDMCVSIDMDERLDPGWVELLQTQAKGTIGNYRYIAEWSDPEKTIPGIIGPRTKIHARPFFEWHRKVHEALRPLPGHQPVGFNTDILVKHYQNNVPRAYSAALDEIIEEDPTDGDARIQRAAESFKLGLFEKTLEDYKEYLKIVTAEDAEKNVQLQFRRYTVLLGMSVVYAQLNDQEKYSKSLLHAIAEWPLGREAWLQLAQGAMGAENYPLAYAALMTARSIKEIPYHAVVDGGSLLHVEQQNKCLTECFNKIKEIEKWR